MNDRHRHSGAVSPDRKVLQRSLRLSPPELNEKSFHPLEFVSDTPDGRKTYLGLIDLKLPEGIAFDTVGFRRGHFL